MFSFLDHFNFDLLSFLLGILLGVLSALLFNRFKNTWASLRQALRNKVQEAQDRLTLSQEARHAGDILRAAQNMHIAASLFPLDEILLQPRLLAPLYPNGETSPPLEDIAEKVIPYLPDWPELAAHYGAPTITLAQALQYGSNILVVGRAGSGKSVALAHLAMQIARQEPTCGNLRNFVPFLVHAANLTLPLEDNQHPLEPLIEAVKKTALILPAKQTRALVGKAFRVKKALLLLDGLDDLGPQSQDHVIHYLEKLFSAFPGLRLAAAIDTFGLDPFTRMGLIPLPMAAWNEQQRNTLLRIWTNQWKKHAFLRTSTKPNPETDPNIIASWLDKDAQMWSPMEWTLKIWAALAGDALGPSRSHAIEAYLRRILPPAKSRQKSKQRTTVENVALRMIHTQQSPLDKKSVESWMSEGPHSLLIARSGGRYTFRHILLGAYLAAQDPAGAALAADLEAQPEWTGKSLLTQFLWGEGIAFDQVVAAAEEAEHDPFSWHLLSLAQALRHARPDVSWRVPIMRQLSSRVQYTSTPPAIRMRLAAAIALSGSPGVAMLFQKLLAASHDELRICACLGCGLLRETQPINPLIALTKANNLDLRRAACLALVSIGVQPALEAVADLLLSGDDETRRAAAEALTNHPLEGHAAIEEASAHEDVLVRRAAIFGLARLRQPWCLERLEKMKLEDEQWVVKTAAAQALEFIALPDPHIPLPLQAASETPWLLAFAAEKKVGISPGDPAKDLCIKAVDEGKEEYALAALYRLGMWGEEDALPAIYEALEAKGANIREAALLCLWMYTIRGFPLPPIDQLMNAIISKGPSEAGR